tara:strand:- start:60 stop:566 length:507 start_codon:yes stop_codon:yes gene_type:complete
MKLRTAIATFLLCASAGAAPAGAQAGFQNEATLSSFSVENVQPALRAAGATSMRIETSASGSRYVAATFSNNRTLVVAPRACDDNGSNCVGLSIRAFWSKRESMSVDVARKVIEQFNDTAVAGGTLLNGKTVLLSHYLIGDYGMPQGNVRVATIVFLSNLDTLRSSTT